MQMRRIRSKYYKTAVPPKESSDQELAAGYWSGNASTSQAKWEYLCASARVVGHLSDSAVPTGRELPRI
jgi:hypothetical protein